jgi:hypothetical protein
MQYAPTRVAALRTAWISGAEWRRGVLHTPNASRRVGIRGMVVSLTVGETVMGPTGGTSNPTNCGVR